MNILNISPELYNELSRLAEAKGLEASKLAEVMLGYYLKDAKFDTQLDPEELAAVNEAIAESEAEEQASLPEITQHNMRAILTRIVTDHSH